MVLKGVNKVEVGKHFGISRNRVSQIQAWAEEQGLVEEIRERIRQQLLPKAADVYTMLFDMPASALADKTVQKGYELKLKAAKHVADGVGAFRRQSEDKTKVTHTMDLTEFMTKRRANLEDAAAAPEFGQLSRGHHTSSGDEGRGERGADLVLDVESVRMGEK
jgi:cation transport regulator ChaB